MRRVRGIVTVLAIAGVFVCLCILGQTGVLTVGAGALLLVFGALWPALWVASLIRPSTRDISFATQMHDASSRIPFISVIIPARNEDPVIATLVSQICAQDYAHWQLVVVANNCSDRTAEQARMAAAADPRVTVLEVDFADGMKADALNIGIQHVDGDVVLEIDADNHVGPTLLGQIARIFEDPNIDACQTQIRAGNASANVLTALQDLEFLIYSEIWNRGRRAVGLSSSIGGTGFAIRTALIKRLGGWRRELVEDFDLHMRLSRIGAKVAYLDTAVVFDEKPVSWAALVRQRRRWMRGHLELASRDDDGQGRVGLVDRAYLYSPLLVGLSVGLFMAGQMAFAWPRLVPTYAYLSPWFWFLSLTASIIAVASVVVRSKSYRLLPLVVPYVLVFSFHWIIVLAFSFVRPSWELTKTEHGVKHSKGVAWKFGARGWVSGALGTLVLLVAVVWLAPLAQGLTQAPNPFDSPILKSGKSVATAEASPVDGVVQGVVHDSDSAPLGDAAVSLAGPVSGTTHTNSSGGFMIAGCPAGAYTVTITAQGRQTVSAQFAIGTTGGMWLDATLSTGTGGLISLPLWY